MDLEEELKQIRIAKNLAYENWRNLETKYADLLTKKASNETKRNNIIK